MSHYGKQYGESLKKKKKLGKKLSYDPAVPLLSIYSQETRIEKDIHPGVHCSTMYNS